MFVIPGLANGVIALAALTMIAKGAYMPRK
jgi:hypothetical protein